MKTKSALSLLFFVALAVGLCAASYFGIGAKNYLGVERIKLGLDLEGGTNIVFEADKADKTMPTQAEMDLAVSVLQERLDRAGETEAEVAQQGKNRINVDIPGYDDPDEAVRKIGRAALLTFKDATGKVLVSGTHVKSATATTQTSQFGAIEHVVALEFTPEGAKAFADATKANIGKSLSIYLDNDMISAPTVNTAITDGKGVITGNFDATSAKALSDLINDGSLPFSLKKLSNTGVGARLGADSLRTGIVSGGVGFGIIILLMLILYKFSGLAANIAFFIYLGLELVILSIFNVTLTLPGIAGIVLSVGMAVDANIIIFERIKDELGAGKTLKASCDSGFKRALPAIIDSNITTIIAAVILFWLGTGPIKGFAQTLTIGVLISMFTAITITRHILKSIIGLGATNPNWHGGKNASK